MDEKYMKLALLLAAKGSPSPNPYVGAVLVKEGKIIGQGYHKKAGMPHAEVEAISSLPNPGDANGATMYVTLEPCNHQGRTPPCTDAIIKAGIKKVVFAMKDPNPEVKGGGEDELRSHAIDVSSGLLENGAKKLNEVFIKYATTGMPFIALKAAMSIDGKIATRTGDSKWITGEKSRKYAHRLRSRYDGVLVGINTVLKDDPELSARIRKGKNPLRIVLDDKLQTPMNAKVLRDAKVLLVTTELYDPGKKRMHEEKGAKVLVCGKEKVDLRKLLTELGRMQITSILVEGGSEVQGSFFDEKLVDKVFLFFAPMIIGGRDAKAAIGGEGIEKISEAIKLRDVKMKKLGQDILFEAYPQY